MRRESRTNGLALCAGLLFAPVAGHAAPDSGKPPASESSAAPHTTAGTASERSSARASQKEREAEHAAEDKKGRNGGALAKRADPAKDLAVQRANVARLRKDAERDRKVGNRIGAWAAEHDAKSAERQIRADEKALRERSSTHDGAGDRATDRSAP